MENYPPYSYPDSGDSSPRSREIDFENPPPSWEENSPPQNYKVKFMVSYNGKIQPRSHDNLLSYIGGETKILSVDRNVKFSSIYSKLASLVSSDETPLSGFTFKYQLPGEDLDALISVTNDDDLEHMMHEFDRMWKGSSKPARLRLFIFPEQVRSSGGSAFSSISSDPGKIDRGSDRDSKFVDTLTSSQRIHQQQLNHQNDQSDVVLDLPPPQVVSPHQPIPVHSNVDFLFGLDNKMPIQVPSPIPAQFPVHVHEPEIAHELNRLQISAHERHLFQMQQHQQQQHSAIYPPKNDENCADPYQNITSLPNIPTNIHAPPQIPPGFWQQVEHHHQQNQQLSNNPANIPANIHPPPQMQQHQFHPQQQQPVYMMHAPPQGHMMHAPPPMMHAPPQGNMYQVQQQRMPAEQVYREQSVYSTPAAVTAVSAAVPAPVQVRGGVTGESMGYSQVAYDNVTGRQVYYAAAGPQGGVLTSPPFPGMATTVVSGGDLRTSGDGKVVQKGVTS